MTWILACVSGLALAMGAEAETYTVLAGAIADADTGRSEALKGSFDASLVESEGSLGQQRPWVRVDDFAFQAGARSFSPAQPIEFDSLTPILFIYIGDQIQLDGDTVGLVRLVSGGDLLDAYEDEVTFRYLEFRSDGRSGGRAVGHVPESDLPRRFELRGTLHEVDRTFRIQRGDCVIPIPYPAPPPPLPPRLELPGGGGIVIDRGGGAIIGLPGRYPERGLTLEIQRDARAVIRISPPAGADPETIEGAIAIAADASPSEAAPVPAVPGDPPLFRVPICNSLQPLLPAEERQVGSFWLIASAAQPVEIDVQPWHRHNRLRLGSRQVIPVALLGSGELDVRDVDEASLRLGPGEAEPLAFRERPSIYRVDVNRDRRLDLLAFFDIRDTGIAFGDTHVCLLAETEDGAPIEGCDAVDTWPRRSR